MEDKGCSDYMLRTSVMTASRKPLVYRGTLENHCLPHARRVYGNSFRLQHNNARAHRAAAVREFLGAEVLQQMPWPACSLDINLLSS